MRDVEAMVDVGDVGDVGTWSLCIAITTGCSVSIEVPSGLPNLMSQSLVLADRLLSAILPTSKDRLSTLG